MSVEVGEALFTWNEYETWYRVVGTLDGGLSPTPVVICHGGRAPRTTTPSRSPS